MAWLLSLLFCASMAAPAPAAGPSKAAPPAPAAPAAAPTDSFEMTVSGQATAVEEFQRVAGPEGTTLDGKVTLKSSDGPGGVLTQHAKIAKDGHLVSYQLDVDVPGQQVVLKASEGKEGAYGMTVTAKGSPTPAHSQDVPAKAPAILLDNSFASHLDGLTRALADLAVDQERAFTALVPQVMQAIPATVKRGPDAKGSLAGAPVATRTYRIVIANISIDLAARATDGALMQADVPIQGVVFKRKGFEAAAPEAEKREAPPLDPRERAIEVVGNVGALPAVLLIPKSATPAPAVLFLSGSGSHDRDETIGPNKPLADIAHGLGDRGIASLRFDKRTYAIHDRGKLGDIRLKDEYYDDASAALALLRGTPGIDPKRIIVVGHSLGAMIAPKVAGEGSGVFGVVMMAPIVRPIDAAIVDQLEFGAKLTGRSADEIAQQTQDVKATFAKIKDPANAAPPAFMGASGAYWRETLALDVPKLVRESKLPILVLQGDKDCQVRKDADFGLLQSSVGDAGGRVRYRSFAGLNHLFMKVEHESTGAEYGMPGHVEPAVISEIADWILTR